MQITCPHCLKTYQIETEIGVDSVICSQCGSAFAPEPTQEHPDINPLTETTVEEAAPELTAPAHNPPHLWPWLITVLLIISAAGIWFQKDAWLDNRWLRSTLINIHLPIQTREKDWLIVPESVGMDWTTRDDSSRVLVVSGAIENLLDSSVPYPAIEVTFYSNTQPDQVLEKRLLPISEIPGTETITHAPFAMPDQLKRAAPLSRREFVLVIESVPESAGDIMLTPRLG
ncbi:Protein of unknown function (DUF3426) [Mariprofundus ferrinatatus]|uniref:MJ0042 family finger-like domain-containing protein n=1 Tax=Mariprofundus ferrinatatus TaxID=1921087 RepID=A0A2K8LE01_9PROT|nr:DUF3426 domain-containing protein [Mariprofundus ferrinatatus]ATX82506.1 Protein of unknown function (DUF3426) [Mariprofundus ferrinatatus]